VSDYRCDGCGKTSRIAEHTPGCPVAEAYRNGTAGAARPTKLLTRWEPTSPGVIGPSVSVHREDVVAMEALWDAVYPAQRTKLYLRGGSTLSVHELFDTLAASAWWEKSWNT
jgi:hypothetical protein